MSTETQKQPRLGFELYSVTGKFIMPSTAQVAAMDPDTQLRFGAVVEADTELQHATAERFAAEKAVTDHLSGEYKEAETELRRVRPKGDRIAMTKEWIRSRNKRNERTSKDRHCCPAVPPAPAR